MKVVLAQLPVQSHDYGYSLENIPLAAGYLKGSVLKALGRDVEVQICPQDTASLGGDASILRWIEEQDPDVVGFSCYLWNVERSLSLCRRLRERLTGVRIVLGGPEASPDNRLLADAAFDAAVWGEGEQAFCDFLASWLAGREDLSAIPGLIVPGPGGCTSTGRRRPVPALGGIPSPYLEGFMERAYSNTVFLETVRGCRYRCTYCSYRKQFGRLRCFDLERTASEVRWAALSGADEISFLDPCFARRPGLTDLLAILVDARAIRDMRISCELNAEDLDEKLVARLASSGVRHVEVGLQSTNEKALARCGRTFDERAFILGVRMLRSHGIHVATDLMVGLPGDGLEDVKRSIDFVIDEGLFDTLNLYPVSVLPDTPLRRRASGMGIAFQALPPYYVLSTSDMGPGEIRAAFAHATARTGVDYFPVDLPGPAGTGPMGEGRRIMNRLVIDPCAGPSWVTPGDVGQALAIEVRDPGWLNKEDAVRKMLGPILEENPYTLISWIVPEECFTPGAVELVESLIPRTDHHPCDREYMSTGNALCSTRLFLETRLECHGKAFIQVPLTGEETAFRAFLPREADARDEAFTAEKLVRIMGHEAAIDFLDIPGDTPNKSHLRLCSVSHSL